MARQMSKEHKEALARGREQGKAVREYLAALETGRKPGRRVGPETLRQRIDDTEAKIAAEPDPTKRVELIQRRLDLQSQLAELDEQPDLESLERDFIESAGEYSERKGITYSAWREAGIPAAVLKHAGIARTRSTG